MLIILILAVSALLQFTAAFLAFRLITLTEKIYSWILISSALCLMGVRRLIPIYYIIFRPENYIPDIIIETVGLVLSFLMFVGVMYIRPIFIERKQVEEALTKSQQRFKNIVDASPMGIHLYELMTDGTLIFNGANPAADRILGIDHAKFVGKTIEEAFPGLIETEVPMRYKEAALYGTPWHTNQIDYNKDKIRGAYEVVAFKTEHGRMSAIFNDITERMQAENELKKHREHLEELVKERTAELEKINANLQTEITERKRMEDEMTRGRNMLRTLIDTMPDEIYAKDSKNRYIMANSSVISSFGLTEFSEIIGKTDFDLMPHKEATASYSEENSVLRARGQIVNFEKPVTDPDGNIHWYAITKVPMHDKDGRITGLVGIKHDITDFKEAEEHLQKAKEAAETANRAKSTFLSSMSHEIRTPMNAIMGFSELMLHDENLTADQADWMKTINQSGEHLLTLINDILEISRIEAGRITFNPSNFNLRAMVREVETMFRAKAESKNLNLLVEISDDLPANVISDEAKLRQILINIAGNAVKFTEEGGIAFRIRTGNGKNGKMNLIAEVEDTGPGISDKEIEGLFQMFGQTEIGIKEGGTGLGLTISQQYAKIMGGHITIESTIQKGTCFTLTVEIIPGEKLEKKEIIKSRVIGLKNGESYRVLIADDRENNRKLLKEMLLSVGFKVEEAKDGFEAIKKFKAWMPDIILMDMRMPVMDGYEAIKNIKSMNTSKDKKIPIIAVTASAFSEDRIKALEAGADAYLRKPFKEREVFESIESCLNVQYVYE